MWKRLARIYPAHVAVLFMLLAYEIVKAGTQSHIGFAARQAAFENNTPGAFLASLGLVQAMGLYPRPPWNAPAWSISTEVWTYLLFGLAFAFLKLRRRAIIVFSGAVILLSYVAILMNPSREDLYLSVEAGFAFFRCLIGFGIGVLCYNGLAAAQPRNANAVESGVQIGLMLLACVAASLWLENSPLTLAMPPLFGGLVYLLAVRRQGLLERGLLLRPIQFLGRISYSLYISHTVLRKYVLTAHHMLAPRVAKYLSPEHVGDLLSLIYVAAAILFGWLVFRYIEVPANAWLLRRAPGKEPLRGSDDVAGVDPAF